MKIVPDTAAVFVPEPVVKIIPELAVLPASCYCSFDVRTLTQALQHLIALST